MKFQLDTSMHIKNLAIHHIQGGAGKSIDIASINIELKLLLSQVKIYPGTTISYLIKLNDGKLEISNLSFHMKR